MGSAPSTFPAFATRWRWLPGRRHGAISAIASLWAGRRRRYALGLGCMLFALALPPHKGGYGAPDALQIPYLPGHHACGGSLFRASIAPCRFCCRFQVGWYGPLPLGLLVLAVFVGNLTIRLLTTPLIRWLGCHLLLINGALNVLSLLACAFFNAANAGLAVLVILYLGGSSLYPVYRQHARVCRCAFRAMSYANTCSAPRHSWPG